MCVRRTWSRVSFLGDNDWIVKMTAVKPFVNFDIINKLVKTMYHAYKNLRS